MIRNQKNKRFSFPAVCKLTQFQTYDNGSDMENILVLFEDFHQRINGTANPDEVPLDLSQIQSFGIRSFGGVYENFKQSGPSTLEIDFIKLI